MNRLNIWIVLLLVSVLLNGVLIGAGARSWFAPEGPASGEAMARSGGFNLRAFLDALPEDSRAEARRRMAAERGALRADMRALMQAHRRAVAALEAEPFDPRAIAAAQAEVRAARAVVQMRTEAVILNVAVDLSEEERRTAMRAALGPRRWFGPDGRRGEPPPADP